MPTTKRARKPKDFMIRGEFIAECFEYHTQPGVRHIYTREFTIDEHGPRFARWLGRAIAWQKEGKK